MFGCVDGIEITTVESLQFDLATIEAATNKFSDDNKIGKGGFGTVYKVGIVLILKFSDIYTWNVLNCDSNIFPG